IGIHGIGRGDPEIHDQFHWTNGCIALTNEQIDQLGKWLKPGVMVKIR
ncbi:MAG: L,D-transpeptidase, partial [Burkholderiales bacterium]|nr:L,D-transpeptidase [Burkholderiales bacterium]